MTSSPATAATRSFEALAYNAAERYRATGITAWRFARGKLTGDPLYASVLDRVRARFESGQVTTLMDVGCGQGLMLALLAEAHPIPSAPPGTSRCHARRLIGIETRPHVAAIARHALGSHAEIISSDARIAVLTAADIVLVCDVLHMMPAHDQEDLIRALVRSLRPGGELLIREADADAGWRFRCVVFANRFKALVKGYSSRNFHFRAASDWKRILTSHGLETESMPMRFGTPFGNTLFIARKNRLPIAT